METKQQERILVVPRAAFDEIGSFQGLHFDVNKYWPLIEHATFADRDPAEKDPSLKQIIPYQIVVRHGHVLSYNRLKGEQRLASKRSVGIGGHMNEDDMNLTNELMQGSHSWSDVYATAAARELGEEITIASPRVTHHAVAWLNDDSNEVGQVHLGVVHIVQLDDMGGVTYGHEKDRHIELLGFKDNLQILADAGAVGGTPLENWSQICMEEFYKLYRNPLARQLEIK